MSAAGAAAAPSPATNAFIQERLPFFTRIVLTARLYYLKGVVKLLYFMLRRFRPLPASQRPTLTKAYPVRPNLENRIFFPKSYTAGSKLPLYIDIHGGGFSLMDPETDDHFCSRLANDNGILVVSINYKKAPASQFPGPMNDTYEIAHAVITDTTLPIDKSRIAIGGFSAGGNLSMAIVQRKPLRDLIQAVVAFYPALDMTQSIDHKLTSRPVTDKEDLLKHNGVLFDFAYVPQGYNRSDPLLSPIFAPRESFPEYMYLIGAEEDLLCGEAQAFAEKMAGVPAGQKGLAAIPSVERKDGWEAGPVRWEVMRRCEHSFTHIPQRGVREQWRQSQYEAIVKRVGDWLMGGPLKA